MIRHRSFSPKLRENLEQKWLSPWPKEAHLHGSKKDETIGPDKLRPRIEPWLTALFQSEHLSLLIGSGLTHAMHWMAAGKGLPGMAPATFTNYKDAIDAAANKSAAAAGREDGNIEDQIRVANELLRGMEIASETR